MGQPKGGPWKLVIVNLVGKSQLPVSALLGSREAMPSPVCRGEETRGLLQVYP